MKTALQDKKIALAYYGDDFTGSTDALEFLCRSGLKTRLFLKSPNEIRPEEVGMSLSMVAEKMSEELLPAFGFLTSLSPEHLHYKVCSTFDSSPEIGNIGRAIEIGRAITGATLTPLLVGAPVLGRYCFMGNLFARMGIGSEGGVYRLDRHPSMSRHPVTPALESDLRLHLSKQTDLKCGLIPFLQLNRTDPETIWQEMLDNGEHIFLIDAFEQQQMTGIGAWLDTWAQYHCLFSVGSSGIEMALGQYWNKKGRFVQNQHWPVLKKVNQLLVVSGSCSPVTGGQIDYALQHGFDECVLMPDLDNGEAYLNNELDLARKSLKEGRSLVIHANGTRVKEQQIDPQQLGKNLARIAQQLVQEFSMVRLLIAGGDTSGAVAKSLGVDALEVLAPFTPGAPVCKAISSRPEINGLELIFKGGQLGTEDYFCRLKYPQQTTIEK